MKVMERYCRKCREWTQEEEWTTGMDDCGDCGDSFTWWICPVCEASYNDHVSTDKPSRRRSVSIEQVTA